MPQVDVSDERRAQIIAAAIAVFVREGYRKTTMPTIAHQAGLSIGGVYWYFKSKAAIVEAILAQLFQADQSDLQALLAWDAPTIERLERFVEGYIEAYTKTAWLNAVGVEFYAEAIHDDKARQAVQHYLAQYRQTFVALLEQGLARGDIQPINPHDVANAILALEEGLALFAVVDPANTDWYSAFHSGMQLILRGLAKP